MDHQSPAVSTTPQYPTRRAALDAERRDRPRRAPIRPWTGRGPTPPNVSRAPRVVPAGSGRRPLPVPRARRSAAPGSALATTTAAAAAFVLFATGALPQSASAAAVTDVTRSTGISRTTDQEFTATRVDEPPVVRDAFGVTTPGFAGDSLPAAAPRGSAVQWPFPGQVRMSSPFGRRIAPCPSCSTSHQGLDLIPGAGTPIGAVAAGTVRVAGMHSEFGQYAVIDHVVGGRRVSTLYAHMQVGSSPLRAGQSVRAGQLVGLVGNSGRSTGAHLHLQVQLDGVTPIDPLAWLRANAGRSN